VLAFLIRRIVLSVVVLATISFASFWVIAAHINPLASLLIFGHGPDNERKIREITARAHLDDSIPSRWWEWVKGMVTGGDGGRTILENVPIWPPVWQALQQTAQVAAASFVVVVVFSLLIGTISARRPGSGTDLVLRGLSYLSWSIPVFLLGLGVQELLRRADASWGVHFFVYPGAGGSDDGPVLDWFREMTLPVLAVSLTFIGAHSRYVRSAMLVALHAPYADTARAKGLTEHRVAFRHSLRNALIPFVTILTLDFGNLVGASFVADYVFRLGGLGALWVYTIAQADPFAVEAVLLVTAVMVLAFTLVGDLLLGVLDPRARIA